MTGEYTGGADAQMLEPLIELFQFNSEVATNAKLFVIFCNANFQITKKLLYQGKIEKTLLPA